METKTMLKATLTAIAMVTFCSLAPSLHFVTPAQAWCTVGSEGCGETGDEGGEDDGGSAGGGGASSQRPDGLGSKTGTGGDGGDIEPLPQSEQIARIEETCNGALHTLAKVTESTVAAFSNRWAVSVIAVCNNGLGHKASIDDAQAVPLRSAIANNPALTEPLGDQGFRVEDIVGVIVSDGAATLYVHKGTV
jgi:hypothetical protein